LGSRATCPSNDERLRLNREITTHDFDVHGMLALANPDMPICKWKPDSSGRLRFNSLATPPRSDGMRGFEDLLDDLQVVDSLPLGELFAPPPSFCKDFTEACSLREAKALSLLSFCNSDSFRDLFRTRSLCSTSTLPTLNGTEDFSVLCTHSHSNPGLSLLRLATEIQSDLHFTCMARITQINSGLNENECLTVEPPQRTLCGGIRLHSMQESPGSNRETVGTHSLHSLRFRT
jgi:hypothetical protein